MFLQNKRNGGKMNNTERERVRVYQEWEMILKNRFSSLGLEITARQKKSFTTCLKAALDYFDNYIMNDRLVKNYIAQLKELNGLLNFSLESCIEYTARRGTTKSLPIPKDDPVLLARFYWQIVQPAVTALHLGLKKLTLEHPDLSVNEKKIAAACFDMAPLFDQIFEKWWHYVIIPTRTSTLSKKEITQELQRLNKTNRYAVLMFSPDHPITEPLTLEIIQQAVEIPFFDAFTTEAEEICLILEQLVNELQSDDEVQDYTRYFHALRNALINTNLEKMKELWLEVDKAFVFIKHDRQLVPAHMMEWGYHHPLLISPELRLMYRTNDYDEQRKIIYQAMLRLGHKVWGDEARTMIDKIDAGVFDTLVFSGDAIDFRMTGQSVPNDPSVRMMGMKVFIDRDSMAKRMERFLYLLKKILDVDTLVWAEKNLTIEMMYLLIFGHEFAHPLGVDEELIKVFDTKKADVEETKATLFAIKAIANMIKKGLLGNQEEAYLKLTAIVLAWCFRTLDKNNFSDDTVAPYVNESMTILTVLLSENILKVTEDGKFNLKENLARSGIVPKALNETVTKRLIETYQTRSVEKLELIVKVFANRENPYVKQTRAIMDKIFC